MITEIMFQNWINEMKSLATKHNDKTAEKIVSDFDNLTIFQFRKKYNMRYY